MSADVRIIPSSIPKSIAFILNFQNLDLYHLITYENINED